MSLNLRSALVVGGFVAVFCLTMAALAHAKVRACSAADVARYEMLLGVSRGGYRTIPQLGFTVQYLGTQALGNGVCAVLVRRAD